MHFLVMILNKGIYNGKRIISEASVETMLKVQTTLEMIKYAPKAAEGFNYAAGEWVLQQMKPAKALQCAAPGCLAPGRWWIYKEVMPVFFYKKFPG